MKRHASMNRVYRVIWSQVLNTWIAVAEIAKGRGKASSNKLVAATLSLTVMTSIMATAQAAPMGGQVISGSGTISHAGATTTINQSSQNLSLNWQSFNIAPTETVNFAQPNASSIAVNRILDTNGSQIMGHLNANGQIYLINPNGIVFGEGAQVNVGGLVASTLDVSDASLNHASQSFSGTGTGSITNLGSINGKYVALIGNTVSNQGTITAQLGTVALGAGNAVTLTFNGNNLVQMQVDQSVLNSLVANGGVIQADGGHVIMSAGAKDSLLASVVNNTGLVRAQTVQNQNGTITLLAGMTAGTLNVSGTLDASAPNGSNGGAIETSAHNVHIAPDAKITTAAANGLAGTWLIDPADFTIAASGGDITGAALSADLASNSVTIQTATGTDTSTNLYANGSTGTGNINVYNNVSWNANTLTLTAANNINVNAVMSATGTAGLALNTGALGNVNIGLNSTGFTGRIDLAPTTSISINGTPYIIIDTLGAQGSTTGTDLQGIEGNLDSRGVFYVLGSNIDASATSTWNGGAGFASIGTSSNLSFTGIFNGLGHVISNLTSSDGLIGYNDGYYTSFGSLITNVGLVGGRSAGAGLVGENHYGSVNNCYVTSNAVSGGLVGVNYGGFISNSYATGNVTMTGNSGVVGGLVAVNAAGTINNSYATGSVNVTGGVNANSSTVGVGGLVGANSGTISNSYATGSVNVTGIVPDNVFVSSYNVGGLVGNNSIYGAGGTISLSYATGNVTGTSNVGGLVGNNSNGGRIFFSYAVGNVTGTSSVGGLVGSNGNGTLSNAFYNVDAVLINSTHQLTIGALYNAQYTDWVTHGENLNIANYSATLPVGTGDYYDVSSIQGLKDMLGFSETNAALNFRLTSNIDLTGDTDFYIPYFAGNFDGGGYTISNLALNGTSSDIGMFGYLTSTSSVSNLGVVNFNISGSSAVGGLAGANYGAITNSYATGSATGSGNNVGGLVGRNYGAIITSYATGSVTGTDDIGGLVGYNFYSGGSATISNSYATGNVTGINNVGGLVGFTSNYGSGRGSTTISNSYATGSVTGTGSSIGGLVGNNNYGTISNAYATGTVTGAGDVGGLVGYNGSGGTISNSYATGSITNTSSSNVGGLVGANYGTINNSYATGSVGGASQSAGGLVGFSYGSISNSYATGSVSGANYSAGGLVGYAGVNQRVTVNNSYWNSTVTGALPGIGGSGQSQAGVTGLTTAQMQQQASFAGFDFTTPVWGFHAGANNNNPVLCVFDGCSSLLTTVYVDPVAGSSVYGSTPAFNYTLVNSSGALLSLTNASITGTAAYSASAPTSTSNVGTYTFGYLSGLSLTGSGATNYALAPWVALTPWTVTPKPITVTGLSGTNRIYDGTNIDILTGRPTLSGLVNNDALTSTLTGVLASPNVGSEGVSATIILYNYSYNNYNTTYSALASNYTLTQPILANVTITPAPLTVTANSTSRAYGAANPGFTDTFSGFVQSENATSAGVTGAAALSTTATPTTAVGTAPIVVGTGTLAAPNYMFTNLVNGVLTINPAVANVTTLNLTGTRPYDGLTDANANIFGGGTVAGVNGQTLTLTGSGTVASPDVGLQNLASLGTLTLGNGNNGGLASNYTLAGGTDTVNITPAPLTVTANNASKTYDTVNPALTASYNGFVNSDTVASLSTAASVTTTATTSSPVGSYPITASGAADANYAFTYVPGTLTVDQQTPVTQTPVTQVPVIAPPPATASNPFVVSLTALLASESESELEKGLNQASGENNGLIGSGGDNEFKTANHYGTGILSSIGNSGLSLQVFNGGVKLPDNLLCFGSSQGNQQCTGTSH